MRLLLKLLLFLTLFAAALAAGLAWLAWRPLALPAAPTEFSVPPGVSLRQAAQAIAASGIELPAWQFELLGRLFGRATKIKAGSYAESETTSAWRLLDKLTRGEVSQNRLLLVEGRTFAEFRAQMDAAPDLRHDSAGLPIADLLAHIGAQEVQPEGLFFPDTYWYDKGSSDLALLTRAYHAMQRRLASVWAARDPALPLQTPYELLILASIVEKETGLAADRPQIAAVFVNRLRRGMPLQTDPTVIYGMGDSFDGDLRRRDLRADTPWNTYTRRGLPPTPISLPGLAALQAAANPPPSDKLYFVAEGGQGGDAPNASVFSRTLEEHNRAVAKHQKKKGNH